MHKNGFVVAVKKSNGEVLRECSEDHNVYLPFESEYSILLKNKTNTKACAKVLIDGKNISSDSDEFIVPCGESVDLKRFLINGNLNKGKGFRFVSASDSRVQDPTDKENGIVEVTFWNELYYNDSFLYYTKDIFKDDNKLDHKFFPPNEPFDYRHSTGEGNSRNIMNCQDYSYNNVVNAFCSSDGCNCGGATVEGKIKHQKFNKVASFIKDTSTKTIIKIKILPLLGEDIGKYCIKCGKKLKNMFQYCPVCGQKRK